MTHLNSELSLERLDTVSGGGGIFGSFFPAILTQRAEMSRRIRRRHPPDRTRTTTVRPGESNLLRLTPLRSGSESRHFPAGDAPDNKRPPS